MAKAKRDRTQKYDHTFRRFERCDDIKLVKDIRFYEYSNPWKRTRRTRIVKSRLTLAVEAAKAEGKGSIIVWKKVYRKFQDNTWISGNALLVKLRVPINAQMRCPKNHKCRASRARVLSIHELDFKNHGAGPEVNYVGRPYNRTRSKLAYEKGAWVRPEFEFSKANIECASGIHFFLTEEEAFKW